MEMDRFVISYVCMAEMEIPSHPFVLTHQHHRILLHFSRTVSSTSVMVDILSRNIVLQSEYLLYVTTVTNMVILLDTVQIRNDAAGAVNNMKENVRMKLS